jgi:hypothetical protein
MKEIRVGWLLGLHEDEDEEPRNGGIWFPESPSALADLRIIVESGCEACGTGTHWIERREA